MPSERAPSQIPGESRAGLEPPKDRPLGTLGIGASPELWIRSDRARGLTEERLERRQSQKRAVEATDKAVMSGLEWLKRHQHPDGSWDPSGYSTQCDATQGAPCQGRGSPVHLPGVTGLALLAFFGAGYDSVRESPYSPVVRRGLKWLRRNQTSGDPYDGCFGPVRETRFTYGHAIATLAMIEAYASTGQWEWRNAAQRGLDFIAECQNPYKGWRYGKKPGDNDTSVTGVSVLALASGRNAGLAVNDAAIGFGIDFINELTDPEAGRTGYTKRGEWPVRPEGLQAKWPGSHSECLSALAVFTRLTAGAAHRDLAFNKAGVELIEKRLPVWDEPGGFIDMYYWYYGTLAMHQWGGQAWDRWHQALKAVVLDHQQSFGCATGSWDPKDPWGEDGGRVYSTAILTLSLETPYRYKRLFEAPKKK
jgi:hypothetical protein